MNWQKRLCGTVSGRMGLPIIDGPHPYFRTVQRTKEEPILLTERKPSRPPPVRGRGQPTIEIDLNDAGVEIIEDTRSQPLASGLPRPPMMAPPPKRERPVPQSQPPRPSPESMAFSLPELIAVASGKKKPAPVAQPAQRSRESSVSRNLVELQEIEKQRVADEAAAKVQEAAEAARLAAEAARAAPVQQRAQENSVELSLRHVQEVEVERIADEAAAERSLLDALEGIHELGREKAAEAGASLLSTYGQPEGAELPAEAEPRTAAAKPEPFVFLPPEIIEPAVEEAREISISIEFEIGLPWGDTHATYNLSGKELDTLESLLPERLRMWVVPAPSANSADKGDKMTLQQFAGEARVETNGKGYYFTKAAFAGARSVTRVGNMLHIWPEASTDYDLLGEVSGEQSLGQPMTGEWSINMKAHILSQEELFKYSALLAEGKPVFIHPVPESQGQLELERSLMETFHEGRIPRITLGKKDYFVMSIGTVAQWQEITFMFPNVRIASRKGEWLGIWPGSETGREMMAFEHGFEHAFHGPMGPPLLESGGIVTPYGTELAAISRLYGTKGEKRWLYPLPEKITEMDSDTLNFLTVISCREIELNGVTPLISLNGRFYVSLKYAYPDARTSSFENDVVRVHPKHVKLRDALAEVRQKAAERKAGAMQPMIVLPPDPAQRKPLMDMFPEGVVKHLYYVEPKNTGYVPHRPHVTLMRGTEKETYLVLDSPHENAIAVKRTGIAIYPIE